MTVLLNDALHYAADGLPVFPIVEGGKEPAVARGFYAATTNPETIKRLWRIANRNIGIPTGLNSGFWVLDIDGADGEQNLRDLEATHGALPPTREVITGGGGRHLWFRYTGPIPSTTGRIAPGIDTRGDGGYVVAPPSIHPNGRRYEWSVDSVDELPDAPAWLVELARKKPTAPISEQALAAIRARCPASPNVYGMAALEYEIEALASTAPGARNHALNRAAFSLFQLIAGGELDEEEVFARLVEACHANGLMTDPDDGPRKVWATIRSARRAGMQHPRTRPGAI